MKNLIKAVIKFPYLQCKYICATAAYQIWTAILAIDLCIHYTNIYNVM